MTFGQIAAVSLATAVNSGVVEESCCLELLPDDALIFVDLRPLKGERTRMEPPKQEMTPPPERSAKDLAWWEWSRLTSDWFGYRAALERAGLFFGGDYMFDWSVPATGGLTRCGAARGLLDLNFRLDTQPTIGIEGGTLFAQYFFRHGPQGSDYVGDLHGFDNMDAERFSKIEEFWYEQFFLAGLLRVKAGQVDANAEFAFVESAGEFLNASAGYSPTLAGLPTYPDPRLSLNLSVYPTRYLYASTGVYGESLYGTGSFSRPYWLAEIGITKPASGTWGTGRLALGGWFDTASLERFDGQQQSGASGFYAVTEHRIWREQPDDPQDEQGLSVFAQYGLGDPRVSPFANHLSAGVSATGMLPGRESDLIGVRWSRAFLSQASAAGFQRDESVWELFYQFQVTEFLAIKPDFQWIQHPGGVATRADAVVATLRLTLEF
jgi:carbohydrate-selective porin OprB